MATIKLKSAYLSIILASPLLFSQSSEVKLLNKIIPNSSATHFSFIKESNKNADESVVENFVSGSSSKITVPIKHESIVVSIQFYNIYFVKFNTDSHDDFNRQIDDRISNKIKFKIHQIPCPIPIANSIRALRCIDIGQHDPQTNGYYLGEQTMYSFHIVNGGDYFSFRTGSFQGNESFKKVVNQIEALIASAKD